jgi:hypothetical protein
VNVRIRSSDGNFWNVPTSSLELLNVPLPGKNGERNRIIKINRIQKRYGFSIVIVIENRVGRYNFPILIVPNRKQKMESGKKKRSVMNKEKLFRKRKSFFCIDSRKSFIQNPIERATSFISRANYVHKAREFSKIMKKIIKTGGRSFFF